MVLIVSTIDSGNVRTVVKLLAVDVIADSNSVLRFTANGKLGIGIVGESLSKAAICWNVVSIAFLVVASNKVWPNPDVRALLTDRPGLEGRTSCFDGSLISPCGDLL